MKYGQITKFIIQTTLQIIIKTIIRELGTFSTVDNLYYDISLQISENKSQDKKSNAFIGTMHKRKGFEELITIANQILTMYINAL